MLMVLIIMFNDPSNVEAQQISDQYWTMLRRWLEKTVEENGGEEERMGTVDTCLLALTRCITILPMMMTMEPVLI